MITEIIGKRGCGKTLLAVKYAQDALAEGKSVWANIRIAGCRQFDDWRTVPKDADMAIIDAVGHLFDGQSDAVAIYRGLMAHMADVHLVVTCQSSRVFGHSATETVEPSMDKMDLIVPTRFNARPLFVLYDTSEVVSA